MIEVRRRSAEPGRDISGAMEGPVSAATLLPQARRVYEGAPRIARGARVVADRHGRRDVVVRRMLAVSDLTALTAGLAVLALAATRAHPYRIYWWGALTFPLWLMLFKSYGLYDRDIRRINHSSVDDVPWVFHSLVVGCVLMWAYYSLLPSNGVVFKQLAGFGLVCGATMLLLRFLVRRTAVRLLGGERVVLVGQARELEVLARKLIGHPEYGAVPIGFLSLSSSAAPWGVLPQLGCLGTVELSNTVQQHRIERVVVAHREVGEETLLSLIRDCRELGVKVSVLPGLLDTIGSSVEIDDVEGLTVLGMNPPMLSRSSRTLKRGMDIIGALALLIATAPIQLAVGLAIWLEDGRPILFRQARVGRWDRRFLVMKFRTMCPDAESKRAALLKQSRDPGWLLLDHDPRVTRIGRFLRRSSLDELPQLWNVLRGDMSLVGPRPLIEMEASQLNGWKRSRIDLKPGLTGLWQVLGRTSIPFDEMVKLDYLYVTNWSLWNDVRLLLRTVPVVFGRRGAN